MNFNSLIAKPVFQFITVVVFMLTQANSYAQQGRSKNWAFGDSILINFNSGSPIVSNSVINSYESNAVISDTNGQLLFYTSGTTVWNNNHQQMPNGFGLYGHESSTDGTLIVPAPSSDSLFYIFTVGSKNGVDGVFNGLAYSIVDMSLNGGLGDITLKNQILYEATTEKLCGTKHSNGNEFWIISHEAETNRFRSYLVGSLGVDPTPVISEVGSVHFANPNGFDGVDAIGGMRISSSGCKLALAHKAYFHGLYNIELFNFDNTSGYLFNPIKLMSQTGLDTPYSVCFAPNNEVLYVACGHYLLQYDLSSNIESTIQSSRTQIATNTLQQSGSSKYDFFGTQITPSQEIYVARLDSPFLSGILSPNTIGPSCNFLDTVLYMPGYNCKYGLPNFIENFIHTGSVEINCEGASVGYDLFEVPSDSEKFILRIVDTMGRDTEDKPNTLLIYIYSDGTTEKVFRVE